MDKRILISLATVIFLSCNKQKKETIKTNTKDSFLTKKEDHNLKTKSIIRYFPKEKEVVEFDTVIAAKNLRITIQSKFLDSYVTNEFDSEGIKYIDKYRNNEKHLIIKQSNKIIIDTVFRKNNFEKLAGKDFLKIAQFHDYSFNEIKNDTIELFGLISKPETDWSFVFNHYFDLSTKKLRIEEYNDDEI
ncbi:DUF4738 domain-containing protein [uncultured Tenacibaculum sp.]|uniref:DUF4738 domain-containing protein n=1 Tax=uncultured Tenacibaculum sp. TaxID=174713 RepID=UPI00261D2838|nr:DUF4738 domain-containing protein [uncultured Tenacibaculum sp.]